jgi:hypothetical protein
MKTFSRIIVVFFILLIAVVVGGYFALTNPNIQKRLIEGRLPEGSSLMAVEVTMSHLRLSGLVVLLPDGTKVKMAKLDTAFSPLAAVFESTINLGALQVEGLRVDLPSQGVRPMPPSVLVSNSGAVATVEPAAPATSRAESSSSSSSSSSSPPSAILYGLGDLEWLFDIESITVDGLLKDGQGTSYKFDIQSDSIRPGGETLIVASLTLVSDVPLHNGLKEFDSQANLNFKQKATGGFERLHLESQTSGKDAQGDSLISISQVLDFEMQGFEETAALSIQFNADVPRPELLSPELAASGALQLEGQVVATLDGEMVTITVAHLKALSSGAPVLNVDLKKVMTLGGKQDFSGELLDVQVTQLPLAWLAPWLPEGMSIEGAPLSLTLSVSRNTQGSLVLRSPQPVLVGPISVSDSGARLFEKVSLVVNPSVEVRADKTIQYTLDALNVSDRYGSFIEGTVSGRLPADAGKTGPLAGIETRVMLQVGLQELYQQPALAGKASIMAGVLSLDITLDEKLKYAFMVQGGIKGLRARSMPGASQDYRFALQGNVTGTSDVWAVGMNLQVGSEKNPSSSLQFTGEARPNEEPLTFKASLTGERIRQSDFNLLAAAFSSVPIQQASSTPSSWTSSSGNYGQNSSQSGSATIAPPWAMVDGEATVAIKEIQLESGHLITGLIAQVLISEPKLLLNEISAKIGSGVFKGSSEVLYAPTQMNAYQLAADITFNQLDPSVFAKKHAGNFPVRGLFDGVFKMTGQGRSLDDAMEDSIADLKVTGKDGVLTAFELDNRGQLGLGLAGLLGESFDRPGISALSNTVPYFKDIHFDNFILELKRGQDKRVLVPQLKLTGEYLLIDATGEVAASRLTELMDQPLNLDLSIGAKGQLVRYLEILQLLQAQTSDDGYRRWIRTMKITGTLADPNTDEVMAVLKSAANRAFSTTKKDLQNEAVSEQTTQAELAPAETPKKKTKEERRREDIELGIDVFNSFFGK